MYFSSIGERTHGDEMAATAPGTMTTIKGRKWGQEGTRKFLSLIYFFYQEAKYLFQTRQICFILLARTESYSCPSCWRDWETECLAKGLAQTSYDQVRKTINTLKTIGWKI